MYKYPSMAAIVIWKNQFVISIAFEQLVPESEYPGLSKDKLDLYWYDAFSFCASSDHTISMIYQIFGDVFSDIAWPHWFNWWTSVS